MSGKVPFATVCTAQQLINDYSAQVIAEQPQGPFFKAQWKRVLNLFDRRFRLTEAGQALADIHTCLVRENPGNPSIEIAFRRILKDLSIVQRTCSTPYGPHIFFTQPDTPYASAARLALQQRLAP